MQYFRPMSDDRDVTLLPIGDRDVTAVAAFLTAHLNSRVSPDAWAQAMRPGWPVDQPNHGFLLEAAGEVVGAYVAFYSERRIGGADHQICNLAAWCVLEEYRGHSLRLVRAMLGQRGYTFTDLSPSGAVVPLNLRLGFEQLDPTTSVAFNLPMPLWSRRVRVLSDPAEVEAALTGENLRVFRDHRDARAARHLVVLDQGRACYVVYRRDRRKQLPLFATILHVSDRAAFARVRRHVLRHLALHERVPFSLVERRVAGAAPWPAIRLSSPRPKMFRSTDLSAGQVDYLYSELTCVPW